MKRLLFFVLILLLVQSVAQADVLPELKRYREAPEQQAARMERYLKIAPWRPTEAYSGEIVRAAVRGDGQTAIYSGFAENSAADTIGVYDLQGNFLYGYLLNMDQRGFGTLFYSHDGSLCYYAHHLDGADSDSCVYVLAVDGTGVMETYGISNVRLLNSYGVDLSSREVVQPESQYQIETLDRYRLVLKNRSNSEQWTVYDVEQAADARKAEQRKWSQEDAMLFGLMGFWALGLALMIGIKVSDAKREKEKQKMRNSQQI